MFRRSVCVTWTVFNVPNLHAYSDGDVMDFGKEFVVKELIRGKHEVWLVEKVTGKLIEKHAARHGRYAA